MIKKFMVLLFSLLFPLFITNAKDVSNDILMATNESPDILTSSYAGGSEFKAGISVNEEEDVDGIFFLAGNKISVKGTSEYGAYAGNEIIINSNIEKELFVAGNDIKFDGNVGRDSYIAGNVIELNGTFGRKLKVAGNAINLENVTIDGDAYIIGQSITFGENVTINGELTYNDNTIISGIEKANILKTNVKHIDIEEDSETFKDNLKDFILSTLSLIVVAFAINFAFPSIYKKLDNKLEFNSLLNRALSGIVFLVIVPIISMFVLITGIGSPLAIIVLLLYGILCYVGKLTILTILANKLCELCFKKKNNIYLAIFIGIVLYKVLDLIPYVGGICSFLALILGFGYTKELLFSKKKNK